ncbi:MAG: SMP-30/gluconolactonase/LRE family protein [Acidobacteria bacterium]|nr:SMP-30/gluconolactonase/LRE family protein [Acidobacteriota bacterium]
MHCNSSGKALLTIVAVLIATGGLCLVSGTQFQFGKDRPNGQPRLIAIDPLPQADGEVCEWQPASFSAPQGQAGTSSPSSAADEAKKSEVEKRKPIRTIRDPYAAYSSVAVDPVHNEVVLTDENLFNILVYDRLANTPPNAKMTEPKRMIGGLNTKIEFQCGLYIDPTNGDIFAVNNDTVDTLVIFNRQAKGNVPPTRELYTPHGTFGIAVDEQAQEMYLTVQHDSAVVVYKKYATKNDSPLRLLQGDNTMLADPHGIAVDPRTNVIFVANHGATHSVDGKLSEHTRRPNFPLERAFAVPGSGRSLPPSITVYEKNASGDTAPIRVISGPNTRMNWPSGLAVDSDRGELYVANDMDDSILVFDITAEGDAAPKRVLKGPATMLKNPTGVFLDTKNDELWSANFGNHTATVFKRTASGNTPPLRVIRSGPTNEPSLGIGNPHPIAYDSKREEILVPN